MHEVCVSDSVLDLEAQPYAQGMHNGLCYELEARPCA